MSDENFMIHVLNNLTEEYNVILGEEQLDAKWEWSKTNWQLHKDVRAKLHKWMFDGEQKIHTTYQRFHWKGSFGEIYQMIQRSV